MAAYRQAKRMQRGVKLGYDQPNNSVLSTQFQSTALSIGTEDFSIEYYGNSFGSNNSNGHRFITSVSRNFGAVSELGENGVFQIILGTYDYTSINWTADSLEEKFLLTITRQSTTVKVYINGELKATKEQSEVKDLGDLQLAIANSSDVGFVRVWNMCLSDGDITAHYNNDDPMGYVVPKAMRDLSPIQITGVNTYTWTGTDDVTEFRVTSSPRLQYLHKYRVNISVSDYQSGTPYLYAGSVVAIPASNGTYDVELEVSDAQYIFLTMYGGSPGSDRRLTLTVNSIAPVGLLAEYLPQNLMESRKYKFPLDSFTQSANTFSCSASTTNKVYDNPQANGFSGEFMRFEAITDITLTCSFYIDVVQRAYPIRVTAEYRSNADLIGGFSSGPVVMSKNEGEASIVSFDIPNGISNSEYIRCANNPEAWIEMRILSIEPIPNMATSWLDSAKQFPLSDEYLPPLFQSIGGYDMAANGAPEILYYGLKPDSKGVTLSSASDPVKSLSLFSGPQIGSGDFTLQVHAYNTYGDLSYTGLIDAFIADEQTQTRLFALELLTNDTYNTCSVATSLLPDIGSGYPPTVGDDGIQFDMDQQAMFDKDAVLTRSGNTLSVYMNGALKATKQVSGISYLSSIVMNIVGDIQVFSLVRVFNKALTAEEVATLHNNGNPDAYVLPASMKQGDQRCVLEWLPANLVPDQSNTSTASEWLDTATVLPEGNVQPKIAKSVGGYDGTFQGNPTIVY